MAKFPYQYININGIPTIKTQTVTVSETSVTFKFAPDFDGRPFRGLILVYISEAIPTGTTDTLPIVFSSNDFTQPLTNVGGEAVTVAQFPEPGVYLVYYSKEANLMQLLTTQIPA